MIMDYSLPKNDLQKAIETFGPVFQLQTSHGVVWVKTIRNSPLRVGIYLQKIFWRLTGSPLLALPQIPSGNQIRHEAARIRALESKGIPVPKILHEDNDYIVLSDAGLPLWQVLESCSEAEGTNLIMAAARALRSLHDVGEAHGGAQIKNITVSAQGQISFIDFEGEIPSKDINALQLRDMFLFLLSLQKYARMDISAVCAAYDGSSSGNTHRRLKLALRHIRFLGLFETIWQDVFSMKDIRCLATLIRCLWTVS